jgi:hypothetical protein
MDPEQPHNLRTAGEPLAGAAAPGARLTPAFGVNAVAELVADLIAATGLVPADKLALVRGRAGQGSFAQALVEEGVATGDGIARMLAARHQLSLVDLALIGVSDEAAHVIPLHVLERVVAVPYALQDGVLRIAVADPANIQSIDELRLATRNTVEISVASRDDILLELRRLARASEAFGARAAVEEEMALEVAADEDADDLEIEDGISDAPLVRLVNSVIFQAAEDGASDVHFEPQEDSLLVRFRVDGVLHEVQRIPKRMMAGVTTRLAQRGGGRPDARHPCRDAADRRGRVGGHASPRQVAQAADAPGAGDVRGHARDARADPRAADRRAARHRSHGLR